MENLPMIEEEAAGTKSRFRTIAIVVAVIAVLALAIVFRARVQSLLGLSPAERVGAGNQSTLPEYKGRPVKEFRPVEEEVKLFTPQQMDILKQRLSDYAGSLNVNKDQLEPWIQAGLIKKGIGDYEGARDAWEYASLIRPKNVVSFRNLGELYWHYLPDFPRAETNLRIAISNDAQVVDPYLTLHELYRYSYKAKADQADDVLLEGLKNNPGNPVLLGYLARYYKETGDKVNAIKYYKELEKVKPGADVEAEIRALQS